MSYALACAADPRDGGAESWPAASIQRGALYLHPGQLVATREPTVVTTILGSCVAVCLWDEVGGAGGVNHYLLPEGAGTDASALRFGNVAIEALIDRLLRLGAQRGRLRAKVFGGACISAVFARQTPNLGATNVTCALDGLAREGLRVDAFDTGGARGRKLLFQTDDGAAWVKQL
jgi:chemotaxis protein CheD